ncbi:MAG: class I SAM-dependent methyltransferase [Planctomycetota bacterium]
MQIEYFNSELKGLNRELAAAFSSAGELSAGQMSACRWAVLDMPGAADAPKDAQKELISRLHGARQAARQGGLGQVFGWCMAAAQAAAVGEIDWGHQDDSALSPVTEFLHEVVPAPATVLDVAAGTGRYSLPLAADGYNTALFDSAAGFLELAAKHADRQGLADRIDGLLCGTFADLPALPAHSCDACVCVGAIFYLPSPQQVEQAVGELGRIASRAVVFDVASKLGTILQMGTEDSDFEFSVDAADQILSTGVTPPGKTECGRVVYSCLSGAELRRLVEGAGMELQQLVGCGPPANKTSDILSRLPPEQRSRADQLPTGDVAIDGAANLLAFCTKAN